MSIYQKPRPSLRKENLFYPAAPTPWKRFTSNPVLFVAKWLYENQSPVAPSSDPLREPKIKVVCISDTHNETPTVPDGDILLHAGDFTQNGSFAELKAQLEWLKTLPHKHKIVVAGNHELILDADFIARASKGIEHLDSHRRDELDWGDILLLKDTSVSLNIRGRNINIFGSPETPKYGNWAFQYLKEHDVWRNKIPPSTDIVLTHGPPKGHLDAKKSGCQHLNRELWRVKPRLAVFGHIHQGRGREDVCWDAVQAMYDAASGCNTKDLEVLGLGILVWVWTWIQWLVLRKKREGITTLVNASIVGDWGIASGTVVEI